MPLVLWVIASLMPSSKLTSQSSLPAKGYLPTNPEEGEMEGWQVVVQVWGGCPGSWRQSFPGLILSSQEVGTLWSGVGPPVSKTTRDSQRFQIFLMIHSWHFSLTVPILDFHRKGLSGAEDLYSQHAHYESLSWTVLQVHPPPWPLPFWILALPPTNQVTLAKLLNIFELQFLHLYNRFKDTYFLALWGFIHVKHSALYLRNSRYFIHQV